VYTQHQLHSENHEHSHAHLPSKTILIAIAVATTVTSSNKNGACKDKNPRGLHDTSSILIASAKSPAAPKFKGVQVFTYKEIEVATNGFSEANFIGNGGFGLMYRGVLSDGTLAAIKLLRREGRQGERAFRVELVLRKEYFIFGSLDRTVLLWDQRAEKCQGLLRVQGRPAISYDDQGLVFAIAFGGYIRMFDARKYEKGPFEIFSVGRDISDANTMKFSNDGRLMLLTTADGHIHVLDSFRGTL
ncbi:hypothetical protein S83_062824, partial [Arachis hypogaea]